MSERKNRLRFATWNLKASSWEHSRRRLEFLKSIDWDVIALQEVSEKAWTIFSEGGLTEGGLYTFEGFGLEKTSRSHGVALLVQNGFSLSEPDLLPENSQIGRTLAAKLHGLQQTVNVLSWHAPNAASSGAAFKMSSYKTIIGWSNSVKGPTVIGLDGNHWNTSNELELNSVPYDETNPFLLESWFFGANPPHRLRDALIEYYKCNPKIYEQRVAEHPLEPLAVSYIRGKTKDRFDYIFISDEFEIIGCQYDYEGAIAAGSDHAIIVSNLSI